MIEQLKRAVTGGTCESESPGFRECRRCGTSVDGSAEVCPSCDSEDIANYDL